MKGKGVPLPSHTDFELHCKTTIIKTVCQWQKSRHTYKWDRTESPETNPGTCEQFTIEEQRIYNKGQSVQ